MHVKYGVEKPIFKGYLYTENFKNLIGASIWNLLLLFMENIHFIKFKKDFAFLAYY